MPWISNRLRAPDGCPWDREQTHQSLRNHLLEEAYEVYDALAAGATPELAGELGDLWLQIVLHAQLAAEAGVFDLADVQAAIAGKIVRRHPHVFGDAVVRTATDVNRQWERIKQAERAAEAAAAGEAAADGAAPPPKSALDGVSRSMPALAASQEMQERAAHLGYDWPSVEGILAKVAEELAELAEAEGPAARAEELGDLLMVVVNLARHHDVDAEAALRAANDKFRRRFGIVERLAAARAAWPCATSPSPSSTRCGTRRRPSWRARMGPGRPRPARPRRGRRRGPRTRWRHDDREPRPGRPPVRAPAGRAAPGHDDPRRPEVGRGVVPHPRRRHRGPVRRHDRGSRPAAPARQGQRLGHRRVLHAPALDRGADPARGDRRQDRRAGPTRSSASSAARCGASSTSAGWASGR